MRERSLTSDVVVIGGGLAGVCAAVAAARLGVRVTLATNRPVLGGNSSSEIRVWVCGASAHGVQRYARETGIMGELWLENQYRNPEGNPYYWDQLLLDVVRAEPAITLLLNTDVLEVDATGPVHHRRISAVRGWTQGSETWTTLHAPVFVDCSGDGLIGYLAGAEHRIGRESAAEHGEPWAPPRADRQLLGSTILFYTRDLGRPVRYVAPAFARDVSTTPIPRNRILRTGDNGCDYWWIEWGGELDTVTDNERIRDELWSVVYGIWDHIKNSGDFDADTLTLEWVGAVPGKREYRRLLGEHVLTQHDILEQTPFADRVAFGGWSIDLHPVEGMYAASPGARQRHPDGIYHLPYRCLYSRNVDNLLMAGRLMSATHVAFGSSRVMATCATLGEAAGTAAALCSRDGLAPATLPVAQLQQALLRQDSSIIGLRADDPLDLAPRAGVTATSTLRELRCIEEKSEPFPLTRDVAVLLPVDPALDALELLVDAEADTTLTVELWETARAENYSPHRLVARRDLEVPAGARQWVHARFDWTPGLPANAVVVVRRARGVALWLADARRDGVLALVRRAGDDPEVDEGIPTEDAPVVEWSARELRRRSFCFAAHPVTAAYAPGRVVDGYQRPYGGPHMWVSGPLADGPAVLTLTWDSPVRLARVHLVFDDDTDEPLNNLHHHRTPFDVVPELISGYRLTARTATGAMPLVEVTANRRRHRVHDFAPVEDVRALELEVLATNGAPAAHVHAVRAYA